MSGIGKRVWEEEASLAKRVKGSTELEAGRESDGESDVSTELVRERMVRGGSAVLREAGLTPPEDLGRIMRALVDLQAQSGSAGC
jgi:hypothetical protein